ncbi:MAG: DUF998 domain-containing protein [Pseudomonadota bacterium]
MTRATYIRAIGYMGLIASALSIALILFADLTVAGNDMVADTISAMAAGERYWYADAGIYALAFAFAVLGLGMAAVHPGGLFWSFATFGYTALGGLIFLIGFRNEYGDSDAETGEVVHFSLVVILGIIMAITAWCSIRGTRELAQNLSARSITLASIWTIGAPAFFILPTGYDGLYERGLGLVAIAIAATMAQVLLTNEKR